MRRGTNYNKKNLCRFEFKSIGARNNALKLLERNGFDYDQVEDMKGYVVQISKTSKYAPILKNSVAFRETAKERIISDEGPGRGQGSGGPGAKIHEGAVSF
jgi:hypothetical protein